LPSSTFSKRGHSGFGQLTLFTSLPEESRSCCLRKPSSNHIAEASYGRGCNSSWRKHRGARTASGVSRRARRAGGAVMRQVADVAPRVGKCTPSARGPHCLQMPHRRQPWPTVSTTPKSIDGNLRDTRAPFAQFGPLAARRAVVVTLYPTKKNGGERGIRTPGPLARSAVFKTTRLGMRMRNRWHQT
jgi:hypothetical protein